MNPATAFSSNVLSGACVGSASGLIPTTERGQVAMQHEHLENEIKVLETKLTMLANRLQPILQSKMPAQAQAQPEAPHPVFCELGTSLYRNAMTIARLNQGLDTLLRDIEL